VKDKKNFARAHTDEVLKVFVSTDHSDKKNLARTHTADILKGFGEYWSNLSTHEQDSADVQELDIDHACEGK